MLYDEAIGMFTGKVSRKMMRYVSVILEKYDITAEQWTVLFRLWENEKINQKQLAEKTYKDQPTIARILDILERKSLVERQLNKEDRRAFLICITEKGRRYAEEIRPFVEGNFKHMLEGISLEEMEVYFKVLTKIDENIDKLQEESNGEK